MFIDFNLNNKIKVQLTDAGRSVYREHYESLRDYFKHTPVYEVREDADGWSEWQAWHFMEIFGQHFGHSSKQPAWMGVKVWVDSIDLTASDVKRLAHKVAREVCDGEV